MNADRSKRYSSALEIRRELEKLCFPGYWDSSVDGTLIGKGKKYDYIYDVIPKPKDLFDYFAYQINRDNNKRSKISNYCSKNISKKDIHKLHVSFFDWVINNAK